MKLRLRQVDALLYLYREEGPPTTAGFAEWMLGLESFLRPKHVMPAAIRAIDGLRFKWLIKLTTDHSTGDWWWVLTDEGRTLAAQIITGEVTA